MIRKENIKNGTNLFIAHQGQKKRRAFFIFFQPKSKLEAGHPIAGNVKVLCAVGDFGNENFILPQKPNSSTNVQLTTSAPIAQNTCYKLAADY